MFQGDRRPVQEFDPDERGYHRVHPDVVEPDGTVDAAHVQCPDLSSYRSKFSLPQYALYPLETNGHCIVFKFYYREVLATAASPDASGGAPIQYSVRTLHDPENDNYGHCETRFYRGDEHMQPNKIGRGAKKIFREHMSRILELELRPGAFLPSPE
jgi:hypothetical protein